MVGSDNNEELGFFARLLDMWRNRDGNSNYHLAMIIILSMVLLWRGYLLGKADLLNWW